MSNLMQKVTELRVRVDFLMTKAEVGKFSGETTLAWRSLQMAKCWLGKLKGELGAENPYPVASSIDKIPPTTDVAENNSDVLKQDEDLKFINAMRSDIQEVIENIQKDGRIDIYYQADLVVQHLSEARFWYGFELGKLRDSQD